MEFITRWLLQVRDAITFAPLFATFGCLLALQLGRPLRPAAAAEREAATEIDEQFRRGEQAWKAACPKPTEDGRCIEIRDGAYHRPHAVLVGRDPALVAEARRRFATVARLWRRMGGGEIPGARERAQPGRAPSVHPNYAAMFRADRDPSRWELRDAVVAAPASSERAGAAHAAAGAAFYLAEAQWEEFIRIERPFDRKMMRDGPAGDEAIRQGGRRLRRRMEAFVVRKLDQLARTRQMYLTLFEMRQAPFDLASVARIGQLYSTFNDDRTGGLTVDNDPAGELLGDTAVAIFEKCVDTAAKNARYDEWFRLCEDELTGLRPGAFPKANEFVPEANHAESEIAPVPPVRELPPGPVQR